MEPIARGLQGETKIARDGLQIVHGWSTGYGKMLIQRLAHLWADGLALLALTNRGWGLKFNSKMRMHMKMRNETESIKKKTIFFFFF